LRDGPGQPDEALLFSVAQSAESQVRAPKGEQRRPAFLTLNPLGRAPVLVDVDLTLWDSHAILAYLGDKSGRLWPTSAAGRADALRWLFFLAGHIHPPAGDLARNRIAVKVLGVPADEVAIARGEKALPEVIRILEGRFADNQWLLGDAFSLADRGYGPILNVVEKAGFSFAGFPRVGAYLAAIRGRPAWKATPKLPVLE
jgi:GSH-dependent disulfide-bond oxidoreductase